MKSIRQSPGNNSLLFHKSSLDRSFPHGEYFIVHVCATGYSVDASNVVSEAKGKAKLGEE